MRRGPLQRFATVTVDEGRIDGDESRSQQDNLEEGVQDIYLQQN
jgi:hypothetical protein